MEGVPAPRRTKRARRVPSKAFAEASLSKEEEKMLQMVRGECIPVCKSAFPPF